MTDVVRRWLAWISRGFAVFLILYGLSLAYQTWWWTHLGLRQRVYDGESQLQIQLNVVWYAFFYTPTMRYAGLLFLSGFIIIFQTLQKPHR